MTEVKDVVGGMDKWLTAAMRLKQIMLDKKPQLKVAKTKCPMPECSGMMVARLVGPKNHGRYYCTKCKMQMME